MAGTVQSAYLVAAAAPYVFLFRHISAWVKEQIFKGGARATPRLLLTLSVVVSLDDDEVDELRRCSSVCNLNHINGGRLWHCPVRCCLHTLSYRARNFRLSSGL